MGFNGSLFEGGVDIIPDSAPADWNNDIGGDWVSLVNKDRAYFCFIAGAAAADDANVIHLDLNQATDAAGTGSKACAAVSKFWYKVGNFTSAADQWTAVELTTPVSDLDLEGYDVGDSTSCFLFEVMSDNLDVDGGFTHLQHYQEADTLAATRYVASMWILTGDQYAQATPLSALG